MTSRHTYTFTALPVEIQQRQQSSNDASTSDRCFDDMSNEAFHKVQSHGLQSQPDQPDEPKQRLLRRRGGHRSAPKRMQIGKRKSDTKQNEICELGVESRERGLGFWELIFRNPVAAAALVPDALILFSAGAIAGAAGQSRLY